MVSPMRHEISLTRIRAALTRNLEKAYILPQTPALNPE